jgi:ribonuclease VapC
VPVAVLDASAILAVLFKERGHEAVLKVIRAGAVTTPTGLAESLTVARRKGHRRTRDQLIDDVSELGVEVIALVPEDAREMAHLLERSDAIASRGTQLGRLSLGDAACLAVAHRLDLPAIVSDTTWEILDAAIRVLPFR